MLRSNTDVIGVIFPNSYDKLVPELVNDRLMASIPFAGRYRLIDFLLSSMVNSDINNITILASQNYTSLLDHLGSGREWDLSRKNGGLHIFPPHATKAMGMYNGRIDALEGILTFLKTQEEKYVLIADTNIAVNFDFSDFVARHIESGADVTIAYKREPLPESVIEAPDASKGLYYTMTLDGDRIVDMQINPRTPGPVNFSMNFYVMDREWLIDVISDAFVRGGIYFERDILMKMLDKIVVNGYEFTGYSARICDLKSYFDENMKLLDDENQEALFGGQQIYTKIRDDNPTRYVGSVSASNVMVADGCIIEGDIENCILFRGVKIGKGSKIKDCILMQDTSIGTNVIMDYVITDKKVRISDGVELKGTGGLPMFISKGKVVK